MATDYRLMMSAYKPTEPVRDRVVNVFHLQNTLAPVLTQQDEEQLCVDAAILWATYRPYPAGWTEVEARLYSLADPEPRVPKHTQVASVVNFAGAAGPREVALCLSFYSEVNRPRSRGRLYIGPWPSSQMVERPNLNGAGTPGEYLATLAQGIADLGGVDIDWQIHSLRDIAFKKVTNWWIDNEWDTQRRRGLRGTERRIGATSE